MATLNVRAFQPKIGTLSLQSRISGRQYDDDANAHLLHGYFRLDAYGSHDFGSRLELFAAGENLFDRDNRSGQDADHYAGYAPGGARRNQREAGTGALKFRPPTSPGQTS